MVDRKVALEALGILCNTFVLHSNDTVDACGGTSVQNLYTNSFIKALLDGEDTCHVSRAIFDHLAAGTHPSEKQPIRRSAKHLVVNEDEFFDAKFDYDFTNIRDTRKYERGGEVYTRPCGWQRFALRVLNKYESNVWLGNKHSRTGSLPGEWPVSYHGTSKKGAECIIEGFYEPGPRKMYGRGIYSTPNIAVAEKFAKRFTAEDGKDYEVILQNRINPQYRQKRHKNEYWLVPVPVGYSHQQEHELVEKAIRPYALLLKEVK